MDGRVGRLCNFLVSWPSGPRLAVRPVTEEGVRSHVLPVPECHLNHVSAPGEMTVHGSRNYSLTVHNTAPLSCVTLVDDNSCLAKFSCLIVCRCVSINVLFNPIFCSY